MHCHVGTVVVSEANPAVATCLTVGHAGYATGHGARGVITSAWQLAQRRKPVSCVAPKTAAFACEQSALFATRFSVQRAAQARASHATMCSTTHCSPGTALEVMPKRATLHAKQAARGQRSDKQRRVTAAILAARASSSPSPASSSPPPPLSSHAAGASGQAASLNIMASSGSAASTSQNETGGGSGSGNSGNGSSSAGSGSGSSGSGSGRGGGGATPGRRDDDRGDDSCRSEADPPSQRDQPQLASCRDNCCYPSRKWWCHACQ